MDQETAEDGLDFTPPDTPSQHYHPTPMVDGETMGNSPSKDDAAEGAAAEGSASGSGSQGSDSQMSQGGVLASLGPLTSPSNPTMGGDGGGPAAAASGAVAKDVAAAAGGAETAAADEDEDTDDEEMTPSM